jgi:potassium efflux system protein
MLKQFNLKIFILLIGLFLLATSQCSALPDAGFYQDQHKLVAMQIDLLKNRLVQATDELAKLQITQKKMLSMLTIDKVSKPLLTQAHLEMTVAKSDHDSISIELAESQQTINRLEKSIQEIDNQLNVVNIFGGKIIHMSKFDVNNLQTELNYQQKLLELEKERANYLQKLQTLAEKSQQFYKDKFLHIEELLKSQTMIQLKEQQTKSELSFQQQQTYWLQRLNQLNNQLSLQQQAKNPDMMRYRQLEADIFYANENINFSYLQMLVARYQDQIDQLKISITRGSSISLLNKISDQVQLLDKQLKRVDQLLTARINILNKRKQFHLQSLKNDPHYLAQLNNLGEQYKIASITIIQLTKSLSDFRTTLDHALHYELSSRQNLPGLDANQWLNIGAEILLLPNLAFHVVKGLMRNFIDALDVMDASWWALLAVLEIFWVTAFYYADRYFVKRFSQWNDIEYGHVNLKWLSLKLLHHHSIDLAVLGNIAWLFFVCNVPGQNADFVMGLAWVWLFFKMAIVLARIYLVETVHDRAGVDVQLYHRLKGTFIIGGVITALMVLVNGLPVSYEVKDLFARLFLVFLLAISLMLLKSWEVLPGLIIPHVDERRTYLRRVIRLLGVLIPLLLIVNSVIGLSGFVNLVYTVSWYESVFLVIMVSYLIIRGLLIEVMEILATLTIRHINNGWLWAEAFLKPIDRVLRLALFLTAWAVLFLSYGWDSQSPVVERLNKLIHYKLGEIFNTSITPLSIVILAVIISLLYWAAKWTREFVYRLLSRRTQDMGIRNSIAILSQYTMITVGIVVGLRILGIDFKALAVVAGMFSLGIGLGLRDLANNFVSGLLLLIERPLKVGDIVAINDQEGDVVHIGSRAVTIRSWDHIDVVVPNSEIFSKTFLNLTAKDNIVRCIIKIQIDRHDKPLTVQSIIYEVLFANNNVLKEPIPEVFLNELAEGIINIEVRYYVNLRLIRSRAEIRSQVLTGIWKAFQENGIESPYPAHEVILSGEKVGHPEKFPSLV